MLVHGLRLTSHSLNEDVIRLLFVKRRLCILTVFLSKEFYWFHIEIYYFLFFVWRVRFLSSRGWPTDHGLHTIFLMCAMLPALLHRLYLDLYLWWVSRNHLRISVKSILLNSVLLINYLPLGSTLGLRVLHPVENPWGVRYTSILISTELS